MTNARRDKQRAQQQARWAFNAIYFILGLVCLGVTYFTNLPYDWLKSFLESLGEVLLGATFITLALSRINDAQTFTFVQDAIQPIIEENLRPVAQLLFSRAVENYRWECHLSKAPSRFVGFTRQRVNLIFTVPELSRKIFALCGASTAKELFDEYEGDPECILRWKIDAPSGSIDPSDLDVFKIHSVHIEGEEVENILYKQIKIKGVDCAYRYINVPKKHHGEKRQVSICFSLLKPGLDNNHLIVRSSLFRDVTSVEAKLTVDRDIGFKSIHPNTSEITPMTTRGQVFLNEIDHDSHLGYQMRFDFPLRRGSSFLFELHR